MEITVLTGNLNIYILLLLDMRSNFLISLNWL